MVGYLVKELGYIRNLVEPCWLMRFVEAAACNVSQILLEVDDFIVTALLTTTTRRRSNRTSGGGLPLASGRLEPPSTPAEERGPMRTVC